MSISGFSIKRPVFVTMIMSALCLFGWISYTSLGIDLFPRVEFPIITIRTVLPGADPHSIETNVTKPIEDVLSTISSIKHLNSTSADSLSLVFVEFELEKNVDIAYQEVLAQIGTIRSDLPEDVEEPVVQKLDIDAAPVMVLVASSDLPIQKLSFIVEKSIKDRLQRIPGVGLITIVGKRDRNIWVYVDPNKLEGFHLSADEVVEALKAHHVDIPGGHLETGPYEFTVKTKAEFSDVENFNDLLIAYRNDSPVYLSQIARIVDGLEEKRTCSRLNDNESIALLIRRQSGTNTVAVVHAVKHELEKLKEELAEKKISIGITQDNSIYIESSIREMQTHLLFGGFLAVFIVFLFLRNIQITLISAITIPISILSTFFLMYALGFTLNTMTMLALSLAIGILIDDAIVVVENIFRHFKLNKSSSVAAKEGSEEIGAAAFAITMSIVAVFLPVAFMKGMIGRFFYQFGVTVAFAVLMSLFVAFTLTPTLSALFLKPSPKQGRLSLWIDKVLHSIDSWYKQLFIVAMSYKKAALCIAGACLMASLCLFHFIPSEFLPTEDRSEFNIKIQVPLGSSLKTTDALLTQIRHSLEKEPWVDYAFTAIGTGNLEKVNEGYIYVKMIDKRKRKITQNDAMKRTREMTSGFKDVKVNIACIAQVSDESKGSSAINLQIEGENLSVLENLASSIIGELKKREGYVDIDTSYDPEKPELHLYIKRERAAALGITPQQIAQAVKILIGGEDVTKFTEGGERYDISVRLEEPFRGTKESIYSLSVRSHDGNLISLDNLIDVVESKGPVQIDRFNRQRIISVYANLKEGQKTLGEAVKEIQSIVEKTHAPAGYSFNFLGKAESMKESFKYLLFAICLASVMVYMVLASQFESFLHPCTIMVSLPLAFVGALPALFLTGSSLNIFTYIGFIMLIGLVTKNAILLVDYTNIVRKEESLPVEEALLQAAVTRLHPILMTTFAMIFGMLPIALGTGEGSEAHAPMAIAVIGGLVSSMFLTLIVIPVVYALSDRLFLKNYRLKNDQKPSY